MGTRSHRAFSPDDPRSEDGRRKSSAIELTWGDFEANYPRYYTYGQAKANVTEADMKCWVDLSLVSLSHLHSSLCMLNYRHKTPITVLVNTPVVQVYQIFRTMGLRHLFVLKQDGTAAGVITRKSLTHDWLDRRHHEKLCSKVTKRGRTFSVKRSLFDV